MKKLLKNLDGKGPYAFAGCLVTGFLGVVAFVLILIALVWGTIGYVGISVWNAPDVQEFLGNEN